MWRMNSSHSKLTDWGLAHLAIEKNYMILDVGCGGGRTVSKLAAMATQGKVYGADYSEESVAATKKSNAGAIEAGRVEVRHGSVSQLPFSDGMFDLVTAVETHFWWPNLAADIREVFRVVKPCCNGFTPTIETGYAPRLSARSPRKEGRSGTESYCLMER